MPFITFQKKEDKVNAYALVHVHIYIYGKYYGCVRMFVFFFAHNWGAHQIAMSKFESMILLQG